MYVLTYGVEPVLISGDRSAIVCTLGQHKADTTKRLLDMYPGLTHEDTTSRRGMNAMDVMGNYYLRETDELGATISERRIDRIVLYTKVPAPMMA